MHLYLHVVFTASAHTPTYIYLCYSLVIDNNFSLYTSFFLPFSCILDTWLLKYRIIFFINPNLVPKQKIWNTLQDENYWTLESFSKAFTEESCFSLLADVFFFITNNTFSVISLDHSLFFQGFPLKQWIIPFFLFCNL